MKRKYYLSMFKSVEIEVRAEHNSSAWPKLKICGNYCTYGRLAQALRKKYANAGEKTIASAVCAFVYRNIRYDKKTPRYSDEETLYYGRGKCTEFTIMAVTLLRHMGVYSEILVTYDHMVFKAGGIVFDPTINRGYFGWSDDEFTDRVVRTVPVPPLTINTVR